MYVFFSFRVPNNRIYVSIYFCKVFSLIDLNAQDKKGNDYI